MKNTLFTTPTIAKGTLLLLLFFTWALPVAAQDTLRIQHSPAQVIGILRDTLFSINTKQGTLSANERAQNVSKRIKRLYEDDFLVLDSIQVIQQDNTEDIVYKELIILSISQADAKIAQKEAKILATEYLQIIKADIIKAKQENDVFKLLGRVALVLLVISVAWFLVWIIAKGYNKFLHFVESKEDKWLKNLSYKDYTFLTASQEMAILTRVIKLSRWIVYVILFYMTLPVIFSIFPFSREWAGALFKLIWSPFRGMLLAIWDFMPHLFSLLVIAVVMKYVNQFVKYLFNEVKDGKLTINGFHEDWAMPTYNIVRFLLVAFTLVLMFPHLPGSSSDVFKGVSVFIGFLVSLGSSSAISNIVAGLVITYMRPFRIGDRIKLGDTTGDVIEKTLLVTRLRTPKNEEITIPNSTILIGNTTNYTALSKSEGLIIHTSITIGYDTPWPLVHKALETAAANTANLMPTPKPFVLQTSLDDFYVEYQINAYTKEASKQASIYSELHQNIQNSFNQAGIEIMSPHYRANRDGDKTTIQPSSN